MTARLDGRIAVITGASQGLGEAVARLFAERGAGGLLLTGRNAERGQAVASEISAAGCPARFHAADLAEVEACRGAIAAADAAFGRLECLVNCAGLTDRGSILDTTPETYDRLFNVNARAPFFLIQEAAKLMRRDRIAGAIVNVISMSAHGGQPFLAAYSASKGALAVLTRNAAYALLPDRIRVNGLNLGWTDTPGEDAIQRRAHNAEEGWLARAEAGQPFGRLIKPAEAARAIAFLASEESGLMTGALVDFDQSVHGAYDSGPHPERRLA